MDDVHSGLPEEHLAALMVKLLAIAPELMVTAIELELCAGEIVADDVYGRSYIFLSGLYPAERTIAERLHTLSAGRPPWPGVDVKAIPWVEGKTASELAESQVQAIPLAVQWKVLVITGGLSVGKTTLVNSILKILRAKQIKVAICAPTGRGPQTSQREYRSGGEDDPPPPRNGPEDERGKRESFTVAAEDPVAPTCRKVIVIKRERISCGLFAIAMLCRTVRTVQSCIAAMIHRGHCSAAPTRPGRKPPNVPVLEWLCAELRAY